METKYFQHLDREHLGQVTTLERVEEDDDMTLFHFADGTKCNVEFCAPADDQTAFKNGMVMAAISSPDNQWRFEEKVIQHKSKEGVTKDGEHVIIQDPYLDPKGEKGPQGEVKKMVGIPPAKISRVKLDQFGLGQIEKTKSAKPQIEQPAPQPEAPAESKPSEAEFFKIAKVPSKLLIDVRDIPTVYVTDGNATLSVDLAKQLCPTEGPVSEEHKYSSTDPIYILIDKCKKKECLFSLDIKAMFPGKSLYNLIKDDYGEENLEKFFDIVVSSLDLEEVKATIKSALKDEYESVEN